MRSGWRRRLTRLSGKAKASIKHTPEISVIICAPGNPARGLFSAGAGCAQKPRRCPGRQWELLLVDNASKEPLATGKWELSHGNPRGRHVPEAELGLTPARLRGIAESRNQIIVFVDDDNVLAPNYLEQAVEIARKFPFVAAWGGRIDPEFEADPPDWIHRFWTYLALHPVERSYWSNIATDFSLPPLRRRPVHPCRSVARGVCAIAQRGRAAKTIRSQGAVADVLRRYGSGFDRVRPGAYLRIVPGIAVAASDPAGTSLGGTTC